MEAVKKFYIRAEFGYSGGNTNDIVAGQVYDPLPSAVRILGSVTTFTLYGNTGFYEKSKVAV